MSQGTQRKLTTILAADVVGYSMLMSSDEEATLRTLHTYREVTDSLVEKHGGRVFNTAGDAFLAEFGSAVEAVRCAISIQEDLAVRNSELPEEKQMWFRIGVNVGDVMVDRDDLFGDGVNVAARLEGLAQTGGICISGSTFEQVKRKLSIAFDDMGGQKVKNIPEPVQVFRVVPGNVAVSESNQNLVPIAPTGRPGVKAGLVLAGATAALLAAAYFTGIFPSKRSAEQPFDGRWQVHVHSLSGCRDNSDKRYFVMIKDGQIDEPGQLLPKTGEITPQGLATIEVTDRAGNLRNTQTISISGDTGDGRFQGVKPGCAGTVSMVRME